MSRSKARLSRTSPSARLRSGGFILAPVVVVAVAVLALALFTRAPQHTPQTGATHDATPPAKPQGTQTTNFPTTENWTVASDLPTQVTRLAFSASDANRGYAVAFVNKQTQALYTSTDGGANWRQSSTLQTSVGDFLATDPLDPQDVAVLSAYAPTPGVYTFQRSLDGGQTWAAQTTTLPAAGQVTQTGWSGSTLLVGFELAGQLHGASALVAFPKGRPGVHLDQNGQLNGAAIPHLRLLTGRGATIEVWGEDDAATPHITRLATSNLGASWSARPTTLLGAPFTAVAASDDAGAIVATSADQKRVAVSTDGGATWKEQPAFTGAQPATHGVFVTAKKQTIALIGSDGTYLTHGGTWSRLTSKQIATLSDGGDQHAARLWAYDAQGRVIWLDA